MGTALQMLLIANLLATVLMPPALVFLLMMANDPSLMGSRANSQVTNAVGILITGLVTLAGAGYAIVAFANSFGSGSGWAMPDTDVQRLSQRHPDEELLLALEPDQRVPASSVALPRCVLSRTANLALWGVRVFLLLISALVAYTFVLFLL
jgi:hypothetical protein